MALIVKGQAELIKKFESLSRRMSRQVMERVLVKAAEPIRAQAEANAFRSDEPPHLAENIGIRIDSRTDDTTVRVGPVRGFAYGLPQEIGSIRNPARPFMRPAFDSKHGEATKIAAEESWKELIGNGIPLPMMGGDEGGE